MVAVSAVTTVTAGLAYRYDVRANDPDGEPLAYRLDFAPAGMTIDQLGRITWPTATANIGPHAVQVTVTDSRGAAVSQSYVLTVAADTERSAVTILVNVDPATLGAPVMIAVLATDNVVTVPQRRPLPLDYEVEVDVDRFDADYSGRAVLDARWRVFGADGNELIGEGRSTIVEPAADAGSYEDIVAAMSRALAGLSSAIAGAIEQHRAR